MKRVAWVAMVCVLAGAGCRKHHHGHSSKGKPVPEALWPDAQITVNEGSTFKVVLTLDKPSDDPTEIFLSSDDPSRVTLPASVVYAPGTTTKDVTITAIADGDSAEQIVQVSAEAPFETNVMGIRLRETSAALGGALGPVPAGPGRAVLVTDGPDGIWSTADDTLAVASGVGGGVPLVTHVTIGAVTPGPHALPVVTGVSDTVLVMTNGPDLALGTSDDTLVEVGGISGASPAMTDSSVVGRLEASEGRRPVMIGTRAAYLTRGADLLTSGDDQIVIVDGIGTGTLTVTSTTIPGVAFESPSILVPVDSSSAAISLSGADFLFGTADDIAGVVVGIGGVLSGITLGTFPQYPGRMGVPVVVGPTTVVTMYVGGDLFPGTADDAVVVWQNATTVPLPLVFPVGAVLVDAEARPLATGGDGLLVPLRGADLADFTGDDQVALLTALSTPVPPAPVNLSAAFPIPGTGGRLAALSPTSAVRLTAGADGSLGTSDDGLVVLTALSGAGASATASTGPLQDTQPLASSPTAAVVAGEGSDGSAGTSDDAVVVVSGIGGSTSTTSVFPGPFLLSGPAAIVPDGASVHLLARTAGSDAAPGTADDRLSTATLP